MEATKSRVISVDLDQDPFGIDDMIDELERNLEELRKRIPPQPQGRPFDTELNQEFRALRQTIREVERYPDCFGARDAMNRVSNDVMRIRETLSSIVDNLVEYDRMNDAVRPYYRAAHRILPNLDVACIGLVAMVKLL